MQLNIEDSEVRALAAEVANLCGETETEVIRKALLERLQRLALGGIRTPRYDRLMCFLEREIWPATRGVSTLGPEEETDILGYGPEGV